MRFVAVPVLILCIPPVYCWRLRESAGKGFMLNHLEIIDAHFVKPISQHENVPLTPLIHTAFWILTTPSKRASEHLNAELS